MRKIVFAISMVILLIVINNLVRSIYDLWRKQDLLTSARQEFQVQKNENIRLKQELSKVNKPDFIETEARDKLFLVKPGEEDVLIPDDLLNPHKESKKIPPPPNWKQWLSILF